MRPLLLFAVLALLALTLVGVHRRRGRAEDRDRPGTGRGATAHGGLRSAGGAPRRGRLITGVADSRAAVASIVTDAVLEEPIVRVKLWTREGEIVYSDELRLVGDRYPLDPEDLEVLDRGGVVSEVTDLTGSENRFERDFGELLEVYTRIETPDGTPLLFETYQLASNIADRRRELAANHVPAGQRRQVFMSDNGARFFTRGSRGEATSGSPDGSGTVVGRDQTWPVQRPQRLEAEALPRGRTDRGRVRGRLQRLGAEVEGPHREERHVIFRGTRRTHGPSGSFELRAVTPNRRGPDAFRARATNLGSGETCRGAAAASFLSRPSVRADARRPIASRIGRRAMWRDATLRVGGIRAFGLA